jgi:magnesium and cobalt transporter
MDGSDSSNKPTFLERLSTMLLREPEDREQLIALLHSAYERNLLDSDALSMMEGVIQVSERQVREIMIPRAQMDVIDISHPPEQFIPYVINTAHSRFPVTDGDKDNIIGILLAKDLLRYYAGEEFDVRDMLRPAVFVPESKRLNVLLRDFRSNRNHIALVVDEYGGVCGMVTIEDVLEQIVGDIADEYDFDEDEDNIIRQDDAHWRVKAWCSRPQASCPSATSASRSVNGNSLCCALTAEDCIRCWQSVLLSNHPIKLDCSQSVSAAI